MPMSPGRLCRPGKVKRYPCGAAYPRWVVADSGHHQVVMVADGVEVARYGSGVAGFADGPAREARFCRPQGVAAACDALYVADTGNHALRRIDLLEERVTTLAGPGGAVLLAAPWDVEVLGSRLLFIDVGHGRVGALELERLTLHDLVGVEAASCGALALDAPGRRLYFVDGAALRVLELDRGTVQTLAQCPGGRPDGLALRRESLLVAADGAVWALPLAGGRPVDLLAGLWSGRPAGVAADDWDRIVLTEGDHHRLLECRLGERIVRTLFA